MRRQEPARRGRNLAPLLGVGLLIAAGGAAWAASIDFRAAAVTNALAAAGAAGQSDERLARSLADADEALASGAPSAELAELAASRALLDQPADLDAAEAKTREALSRSPARAGAWARLAYIDVARDGALDGPGLDALARSYEVEPFAPEALRHWRVEFILSRWSDVSEELRTAALVEAHAAATGGARWYEESLWSWSLADRLPPEASAALLAATSMEDSSD